MNIILSVYSEEAFKEYQLPPLNNADYSVTLRSDFFHLKQNLNLHLEVMDHEWRLKKDRRYSLWMNDKKYNEKPLQDNDIISIQIEGEKGVILIVKYVDSIFHAYHKYQLAGMDQITIGEQKDNDISYDYMHLVSRRHAVIERAGAGFKIVNHSLNGTYVNSHRIEKEQQLEFGAYIDIMGLRMVYLGDFLAVDAVGSGASINERKLRRCMPGGRRAGEYADGPLSMGKTVYHRAPRTFKGLEESAVEIEAPPPVNPVKSQPMLLTVGPSLTMALPMVLGLVLMSYSSAGGSALSLYSGLVMSVGSAVLGVFWALQNIRYQKKEETELKNLRFESYSAYLVEKTEEIKAKYEQTSQSLFDMYPKASDCLAYDGRRGILWNRNTTHRDYLKHRLGIGNVPFQISIHVPKQKFSLYKDELAEKPGFIKENYETLYDVPVVLDLAQHSLIGIVGGPQQAGAVEAAKIITAQIAANNCYTDVKLGFIYNNETSNVEEKWKFAKWLPHVWSEDKKTRYIASNAEQTSDVFYELTKIFRNRLEETEEKRDRKGEIPKPYYVLFISDPDALEGELIAKYIFGKESACGLTTFILAQRYEELPNACDFIIENTAQFQGMYDVTAGEEQKQKITFDEADDRTLELFSRRLAALQVREMEKGGEIPNSLTFFEMMDAARPQDIPVKELWAKNRTYDNIKGMIGVKAGGVPCYLDVHEKYHGPHGLVAGTTGSGKSETLQTYMLSLAVNYSPDDIGFFIIDYKGGGMANLFDGLPHMAGQISNLSGNQVKRAMISIKSENRRRQRVFSEHGVNNINLYTRLYKNGEASLPVPHLFIIIDEFAELKKEEPDFMRELISVAQVGRSLGVHMILATQKPGGTVDDNILSNSKFRLCLRVQDKKDSNDMLHKPDAAYITQAGRCYLQVGSDEVYELFQSGYSGAAYEENLDMGSTDIAKMLNLNGKVEMTGSSVKLSQKKKAEYIWLEQLSVCLRAAVKMSECSLNEALSDTEKLSMLIDYMYEAMWKKKLEYPKSQYNSDRLADFARLYGETAAERGEGGEPIGDFIIQFLNRAAVKKVKLPQKKEKTQLDAVKEYLAVVAQECGYDYHMQLWMPVLPERIYLREFEEFNQNSCKDGQWPQHRGHWSLEFVIGKVDDPANQDQMPLSVNFAKTGHLAVFGSVVSGKSTMLQTMAYALIHRYTPQMVNIYALDFSSKMMSAFEAAPHVGGIMYENDLNKISKFFNMIGSILEERKTLFRGGNYSQYVQMNGITVPAILIFVDNYASFKEKTEEVYEDTMIRLSKEGVSHGIFLIVSGSGIGMNDITSRVCENITASLCLQLKDRFEYMEFLHTNLIDVMPEGGVKGRGLADYEGSVLEFQTALAVEAENDYQRMELIRAECEEMQKAWTGKAARKIPEIPKKPVWSEFHELDEYKAVLSDRDLLPAAYDAANAQIYGIDLRKIYSYVIYGAAGSGKTNFLKVCIQAAVEKGGNVCVIDNDARDLRSYEKENVYYACDEQGVYNYLLQLQPVFEERNQKKWELLNQDCEEDEIYDVMAREVPYFIFIADLQWFVPFIMNAEKPMDGFLKTIIEKGRLHNIYFFSTVSNEGHRNISGDVLYDLFTGYKTGVHFGGNVDDNRVLNFDYMNFRDMSKSEAPGIGILPDVSSDADTSRIVVPLARR